MLTLSAVLSLNALRVTCHQPVGGISVGASACSPGLGESVPDLTVRGAVVAFKWLLDLVG
jgi:hypothetical protein